MARSPFLRRLPVRHQPKGVFFKAETNSNINCSSLDDPKCAKCGEIHRTGSLSSENKSCVNCVPNNLSDTNHPK